MLSLQFAPLNGISNKKCITLLMIISVSPTNSTTAVRLPQWVAWHKSSDSSINSVCGPNLLFVKEEKSEASEWKFNFRCTFPAPTRSPTVSCKIMTIIIPSRIHAEAQTTYLFKLIPNDMGKFKLAKMVG